MGKELDQMIVVILFLLCFAFSSMWQYATISYIGMAVFALIFLFKI